MKNQSSVREWVQEYYGEILGKSADLQTNACCATGAPPSWLAAMLANVHEEVSSRFYGCGFPFPEALEGTTVLDLGCGTGRDVYVLSQLVGPSGRVIGVDMTDSQLDVARRHSDWHADRFGFAKPNVEFHQGYIEDLSEIDDASVEVIVSNCVVNLSPRKDLVMKEVARVLAPGGEVYFSDVFADRRLPKDIATDPVLYGECLGGAMYRPDFMVLARDVGFLDPRIVSNAPITIGSDEIITKVGAARFFSTTVRMLKLPELDFQCEDYGQVATYRGGMPTAPTLFRLDDHHLFEAGRPERVCGNTVDMLSKTRFGRYFDIAGDKSTHYGVFDCKATMAADQYDAEAVAAPACC